MENGELAALFEELADLLEVQAESAFKVRAYRAAADSLRNLGEPASALRARDALHQVPGFGDAIVQKIGQALDTGTFDALERARAAVGMDVATLRRIPGLGPKTLLKLRDEAGVRTLADLEDALAHGRIARAAGLGAALERKVRDGLPLVKAALAARRLDEARALGERLIGRLGGGRVLGDVRRWEPVVHELVLASTGDPVGVPASDELFPIRVVQVDDARHGRLAIELTGPPEHVDAMRDRARQRALAWEDLTGDEAAVYRALGLPLVPPELRGGATTLADETLARMPALVTRASMRGDLQCHTTWSDGATDAFAMAAAARDRGHQYLGVTDHAGALPIAGALDASRIDAYAQDLRDAGDRAGIRVLAGAEVEVDRVGRLTLPDAALARLDFVAAGIHQGLDLPPEQQTARYLEVVQHPLVSIVLHPTGRIVNGRHGARLDLDRVIEAAVENRVAFEVNSSPLRMDLDAPHARKVLDAGGWLAVSTDAHAPAELARLDYGVMTARKAWAPAERVINTWDAARLYDFVHRV